VNLKTIDWNLWRPRLAYGGFALLAFALSLRWTFPSEAVRERLILEAGARGWQIEVADVGPGGLLGVTAEGVQLEDASGLKIPIDRVTASLRILPLLTGKQVLAFDALVYDGRVTGTADLKGAVRRLAMEVSGLDLSRALPLRKATGVDLQGKLAGTVDLSVPAAPAEKPTGRIDLAVAEAGINGGQVPIAAMGGAPIALPRIALGAVTANVKLDGGKANVEKLEAKGGDAELAGEGLSVTLQPKLEYAPLFGRARLRLQPALWTRAGASGFKGLAEAALASARTPDGAYQFQVFGSLGHPQLRPVPNAQ
jgi:type II secretion system protein N